MSLSLSLSLSISFSLSLSLSLYCSLSLSLARSRSQARRLESYRAITNELSPLKLCLSPLMFFAEIAQKCISPATDDLISRDFNFLFIFQYLECAVFDNKEPVIPMHPSGNLELRPLYFHAVVVVP